MIFVALLFVVLIFGLGIFFVWTGRALRPTPEERRKHSKSEPHGGGPRATGLN